MRAAAALLALVLLAGCIGALSPDRSGEGDGCPPAPKGQFATRIVWGFDPRQPSDELFRIDNLTVSTAITGETRFGDADAVAANLTLYGGGDTTRFGSLRVAEAPDSAPSYAATVRMKRQADGDCWNQAFFFKQRGGTGGVTSTEGRLLEPGMGTHLLYAGFWTNGTLFGTNIVDLHESDWPRAGWYTWEGSAPLPVYVYDQDRSEQPAYWKSASANVAAAPRPGTPVDDPLFDAAATGAGTADGTAGLGYFTTIEGFNEALKGLSTETSRVVLVPPEKAYTQPGREDHVLYGDAIVFLILPRDVVAAPCPDLSVEELSLVESCADLPA